MQYQSPAKIAKSVGKGKRWLIARCNENKLPHIKENGRYLIDADKIEEAFAAMEGAVIVANSKMLYPRNGKIKTRYKL